MSRVGRPDRCPADVLSQERKTTTGERNGAGLDEGDVPPWTADGCVQVSGVVAGRDERLIRNQVNYKMGEAQAQLAAVGQRRLRDRRAVHVGAVTRAQVFHHQFAIFNRQATMSPADPAVIDP